MVMSLVDTAELRRRGLHNEAEAADATEESGGNYLPPSMPPAIITDDSATPMRSGAAPHGLPTSAASASAPAASAPDVGPSAAGSSGGAVSHSASSADSAVAACAGTFAERADSGAHNPPPIDTSRAAQDARIAALNGEVPVWVRGNPELDPAMLNAAEQLPVQSFVQSLERNQSQGSVAYSARGSSLDRELTR